MGTMTAMMEDVVDSCFFRVGGGRGLPRGGRAIIVGAVFGAKERMAGVNNLWITFGGDGMTGAGSHRCPGTI